jgi:selenocysteine lyase/cysteine desulfurase
MEELETFHLRTVKNIIPDKFEVGTQNHEGIAGGLGSIEYFEKLPSLLGNETENLSRNKRLRLALTLVRNYEKNISEKLLEVFLKYSNITVYGIKDPKRLDERVPTFAINVSGYSAKEVAKKLALEGINVWSGNYYALEPMTRLGIEEKGGAVRISLVHYNTFEEIDLLDKVLSRI